MLRDEKSVPITFNSTNCRAPCATDVIHAKHSANVFVGIQEVNESNFVSGQLVVLATADGSRPGSRSGAMPSAKQELGQETETVNGLQIRQLK